MEYHDQRESVVKILRELNFEMDRDLAANAPIIELASEENKIKLNAYGQSFCFKPSHSLIYLEQDLFEGDVDVNFGVILKDSKFIESYGLEIGLEVDVLERILINHELVHSVLLQSTPKANFSDINMFSRFQELWSVSKPTDYMHALHEVLALYVAELLSRLDGDEESYKKYKKYISESDTPQSKFYRLYTDLDEAPEKAHFKEWYEKIVSNLVGHVVEHYNNDYCFSAFKHSFPLEDLRIKCL